MRTTQIDAELRAAPGLIQQYASVFTRRGYRFGGIQNQSSKVVADSAVMVFVNDRTGMEVRLAYYPPYKDRPRSFIVSLAKTGRNPVYLVDYFKAHHREDLQASLDAEANNPDFRIYWADFFKKLDQLFAAELKDIVEGKRWEDIPFDFGDYK